MEIATTMKEASLKSVYTFCVGQKESGIKLVLDCMWERTESLMGISRSSAQRIVQERKKAMGTAAKVSLDDFDQGVVQRTIASMYSANKV